MNGDSEATPYLSFERDFQHLYKYCGGRPKHRSDKFIQRKLRQSDFISEYIIFVVNDVIIILFT